MPHTQRSDDSDEQDYHGEEGRKGSKVQKKDGSGGGTKKNVGGPPVKAACLTCRNKKAKCDGIQPTCGNCIKKGTPCEYVKSRRGGARKKKTELDILAEPLAMFLKTLEDLGSYATHQGPSSKSSEPPLSLSAMTSDFPPISADKIVKVYTGAEAIIGGYYAEIYPYAPVLPLPGSVPFSSIIAALGPNVPYFSAISPSPRAGGTPNSTNSGHSPTSSTHSHSQSQTHSGSGSSSSYHPPPTHQLAPKCSPLLLSMLAILVLVPNPQDPNPTSDSSRLLRRTASARYASESMKLVEEYTDRAGNDGDDVPLEVVQALILLAKWEMAQNGNFAKMRSRMGSAVQVSMDLGIHRSDQSIVFPAGEEWKRDVRRRTWWMTFSGLMQSSVISGTLPSVGPYDPRITCEFPVCAVDPDVWGNQMNGLRQVVRAFELVVSSNYPDLTAPDPVRAPGAPPEDASRKDKKKIHEEMVLMDRRVLAMLKDAEKKGVVEVKKGMGAEAELARNFALSTRMMLSVIEIVLHRTAAFPEVAIFSKRMCGMPAIGKPAPPSTQVGRITGHAHGEVLLDHFAVIAEQQARARATPPTAPARSNQAASFQVPPPPPPQQQQQQASSSSSLNGQWFSDSNSLQQQPEVGGWAPSSGSTSYGTSNGNGNGASNGYSSSGFKPEASQAAYTSQVQQFDLASGSSSSFPAATSNSFPAATNGSYPDFIKQAYQTTPHLQAPFPPQYNQIPNPPQPQPSYTPFHPPSNSVPQQQTPTFYSNQTNLAPNPFDYSFDTTFDFVTPAAPAPKPWWEVDGGARSMVAPLEVVPFDQIVLPEGTFGGGFPYNNDGWNQQMQAMGAPLPSTSASTFNPIGIELEQQRQFEERVRNQQQQQQQYQQQQQPQASSSSSSNPPPPPLIYPTQNSYATSPSSSSNSSSHPPELRAHSHSPSSDGESSSKQNLPWGVGPDLKPISHLVPPPKTHGHKAIKDISAIGGLGANMEEGILDEALVIHSSDEDSGPFPPGLSLARTSAAAHSVIRLEIIHRAAQFALEGSPRSLPFCACGLVSAAHSFLLLAVAIQAGDRFNPSTETLSNVTEQDQEQARRQKEVTSLYTNVKIIVAGLRKYGLMWEGIDAMATEVQEALNKATSLTDDMARYRSQPAQDLLMDADAEGEDEDEEYEFDLPPAQSQSNDQQQQQFYSQGGAQQQQQQQQEYWQPPQAQSGQLSYY